MCAHENESLSLLEPLYSLIELAPKIMSLKSINPFSLELVKEHEECPVDELLRIVIRTVEAQDAWKHTTLSHRCNLLRVLAQQLRIHTETHAKLITIEMGKPISESRAEIEKCAFLCEHYADHAANYLQGRELESNYERSFVRYEPMGVFLAIMPWNFPYWQVFRAVIPAILAGNGSILKHASNVTGCGLAIESAFLSAGFPAHLMRTIPISGQSAALLIAHPQIVGISFTGSNQVGEKIAGLAGTQIKKTVMELGGSDPSIVLKDADLQSAAARTVRGRMLNAGQSCIASKRILVDQSILKPFIELVKKEIGAIRLGDPMDVTTTMGPLANQSIHDEIQQQVESSILKGAECWIPEMYADAPMQGCQYPPTLLTEVTREMEVWKEETFGPVMCITAFKNEDEAIQLANDTKWGLGASVYGSNIEQAIKIGSSIQAGTCSINDFVKSDPRVPFGGIKKSGYGRELSIEGILEFTNAKTYNVQK